MSEMSFKSASKKNTSKSIKLLCFRDKPIEPDNVKEMVTAYQKGLPVPKPVYSRKWDTFKVEATAKSAGGFGKNSNSNENQYAAARVRYSADLEANKAFELWSESWASLALRVLKPGGYLLSFGCTKTEHRMVSGIENAGFEIRDKISWLYATGAPKGINLKGKHSGKGTGLAPAVEFIQVFRKPINEKTVLANVEKYGTGAFNIDSCRTSRDSKDIPGWHKSGADGSKGYRGSNTFKIRSMKAEEIQERNGNKGRWPKNVIIDDGVAELLEEQKPGGARFFFVCKPNKKERDRGLDSLEEKSHVFWQTANGTSGKASRMAKERNTAYKNTHPTPKPVILMRWLCRLVTPEGGLVLDNFMGSGTTGVAAIEEGFRFLGFENNKEYFEIAAKRIAYAEKNL